MDSALRARLRDLTLDARHLLTDEARQPLEAGNDDWARTRMHHGLDQVLKKCRTNKSYAIVHGLLEAYAGGER